MSKNYLIGIGGTGARAIEAIVNMCAVGYGPDELSVFLIDPDAGNGNLDRTLSLIKKYNSCYDAFNGEPLTDRYFFKTKINIPKEAKGAYWSIFKDNASSTLLSYINYTILKDSFTESNLSQLVDILFTETELNEPLNKGFRGHPSIGAVVMADPPANEEPFKDFFNDIKTKTNEFDVRVFLVGSIFGGTGAAGVPTLGADSYIKEMGKLNDSKSSIMLGAALVLPYFSFNLNANDMSKEKMFVSNEDFAIATKGALEFYFDKGLAFDQLYFIGDSLLQNVGEFSVGSGTQKNDPHYIEIVVGLAAYDFFTQNFSIDKPEKKYFIASRDNDTISWSDFPVSREEKSVVKRQEAFKLLNATFTTFAYSFCTYGKKARMSINEMLTKENYIKQEWYKKHQFGNVDEKIRKGTDIRNSENKKLLDLFDDFLDSYLRWICAIDTDENVKLINSKQIFEFVENELKLIDPENKTNIANLLKGQSEVNEKFYTYIVNGLNIVDLTKKPFNSAAMKFLSVFYEGAVRFCQKNYKLNKVNELI